MTIDSSALPALFKNNYAVLKMGFLLALVVILLLPLELIRDLVSERMQRRDNVVAEISGAWGAAQALTGPVLIVPYRYSDEPKKWGQSEPRELIGEALFLPDDLNIEATIIPEERQRGIFEAAVYTATLNVSGRFADPDIEALDLPSEAMQWDKARLAIGITDLRGTTGEPSILWGEEEIPFLPGTGGNLRGNGIHAPIQLDLSDDAPRSFSFQLRVRGSSRLTLTPVAKTTIAEISSAWPHPSFDGAYLPAERELGDDGFSASWNVSYLGRDYPQSWTSEKLDAKSWSARAKASRFGVSLVSPVDFYLKSERSVKHGALFIVLIFSAIFIFEVMSPQRVHLVQYALVGAALCLFYLLLLSLAEIIGFLPAYMIAALLSTALITLYIAKVLGSRRRAAPVAGLLATVYIYLYIVLTLESLALVSGAIALFLALAAVMYVTRNVDWYALKRS